MHGPVVPDILPHAVFVVDDEIPLPLMDPLVVDMCLFVVDIVQGAVIVPFVFTLPAADIRIC